MKISVIIPALNESLLLQRVLSSLKNINDPDLEVIVVDGGSEDNTVEIASKYAHQILSAERGRAVQMNQGAAYAGGDVLLFLHADSILTAESLKQLKETMAEPDIVGGAFQLQIDSKKKSLRVISKAVNLRSRFLHLVYGDQGIFVRKEKFNDVGKFLRTPLMEDLEFYSRMRKKGKTVLLEKKITTSARRWEKEGIIYTTFRNWLLLIMYYLGVPSERLQKLYLQVR